MFVIQLFTIYLSCLYFVFVMVYDVQLLSNCLSRLYLVYTLVVSMGLLFTCIVIDCRVCLKCLTCCCLMSSQMITNVFRLQ